MLLEDSKVFSLVVPTYQGTAYLRRCLDYLKHIGYLGHVVLADDSSGEHREFVQAAPERYPELWLDVDAYPHPTRFLDKLCRALGRLEARYVMLCAHDDFIVPEGIEAVLRRLESQPGLAAARGRIARFELVREAPTRASVRLLRHPMRAYLEDTPLERVLRHLRAYSSVFYSMHRRDALIESSRATEAATKNVIFFQYLSSCLTVAAGPVACVEELFYLRQAHAASWAARLQQDYEHWPLLVASPDYSRYYQEFRAALLKALAGAAPESGQREIGRRIDEGYVALVRRGLCSEGEPDPADEEFFTRLGTKGSAENQRLNAVVSFALEYGDTY